MSLVVSSVITTLILMSTVTSAYSFGYYNPVYPPQEITIPEISIPEIPTLDDIQIPVPIISEEEYQELVENTPVDNSDPHDMDFNTWNEEFIYNNPLCNPVPPIDVSELCPWSLLQGFQYPIFVP